MYGGSSSHFDTIMDGPCYKNPEQNYLQKQKSRNKLSAPKQLSTGRCIQKICLHRQRRS